MTEVYSAEKSLGEQVAELLQRKPKNYDVTFSVGLQKIKVEAVKILLKAASPVFEREFDQNWENALVKEVEGIPLPDIEPTVFKLFVDLIISDTWSVDALKSLNLEPDNLLSLLGLSRRFKITKAIKNLEKEVTDFIRNFHEFKDTAEFLKMSPENLESILSCDDIPLSEKDIFESACRWAELQCEQRKIEATGENLREALGSSFLEIRFPSMKFDEFTKVSLSKKNMFTAEERLAIYDFIGTDDDEKAKCDKAQLLFKTNPRNSFSCSVLRLPKPFKITENPPFVCNGTVTNACFRVNKKISLNGVGFLGPIESDTQLDVSVQIKRWDNSKVVLDNGTFQKNISARKGRIFYFLLDEPIKIEPSEFDSQWNPINYYCLHFSLKGETNVSQYKSETSKDEVVQMPGVKFSLYRPQWNSGCPVAELLYKIME